LVFVAKDMDGNVMRLVGNERVSFQMKAAETDEADLISVEGLVEIPARGVCTVLLTPTDTDLDPVEGWYMAGLFAENGAFVSCLGKGSFSLIAWKPALPPA